MGASSLTYTWTATAVPSGAAPVDVQCQRHQCGAEQHGHHQQGGQLYVPGHDHRSEQPDGHEQRQRDREPEIDLDYDEPAVRHLNAGAAQQFTATGYDQFGNALTTQPTFTWTTNVSGGAINPSSGLFASPNTTDIGTVTAGYPLAGGGSLNGSGWVIVTDHAPTVATPASATLGAAPVKTAALAALGADVDTGQSSLTYTWTATSLPGGAAPPTFSANGSNAAQNSTATFSKAGNYTFQVTIADPGGLTATSSISLTVNQTLTTISLAGQPLTATAFDQFGNPMAIQPAFDAATDTITSPLPLVSSVVVTPAASSQLTISGGISGAGSSLTVNGGGTLILSTANSFTGGVSVTSGTLVAANAGAIPSGSSLLVGAGASLLFGPALTGAPAVITNASVDAARSAGPVSAARAGYLRSGWACGWRIDSTSVNGVQAATKLVPPGPAVTSAALFTPQALPTQTLPLKTTKLKPSIVMTDPVQSSQTKAHDAVLQFWYTNNSAYGPKEPVHALRRLP